MKTNPFGAAGKLKTFVVYATGRSGREFRAKNAASAAARAGMRWGLAPGTKIEVYDKRPGHHMPHSTWRYSGSGSAEPIH